MSKKDFLVEIGTEELPPKALLKLSKSFQAGVVDGLKKESLNYTDVRAFATPRRLALLVSQLDEKQEDKQTDKFGPAVKAAFDGEGKPTPAASGFAKSCGVEVSYLGTAEKDGVEKLSREFHFVEFKDAFRTLSYGLNDNDINMMVALADEDEDEFIEELVEDISSFF